MNTPPSFTWQSVCFYVLFSIFRHNPSTRIFFFNFWPSQQSVSFCKLEKKIRGPSGFATITANWEKWRQSDLTEDPRGIARESNVDWLFCKYCKLRIYPASCVLSLKLMAAASRSFERGVHHGWNADLRMRSCQASKSCFPPFYICFFFVSFNANSRCARRDRLIRDDKAI